MKFEALIDSIKQSIVTGISTPVRIVERTFLLDIIAVRSNTRPQYKSLTGVKKFGLIKAIFFNIKTFLKYLFHSTYFNFIILLSAVVMSIVMLIAMISFFLSQVIMPTTNQFVNDSGTLVFNQPLATQHYMFLLNSADLWADSGIEVIEGDHVEITVSGSFYSDIDNLCNAALQNDTTQYIYFHKHHLLNLANIEKTTAINPFSLDSLIDFGALLLRIEQPIDNLPINYVPDSKTQYIHRDHGAHKISFDAQTSGILHFAVNDIPLTDSTIDAMKKEKYFKNDTTSYKDYKANLEKYGDQFARKWFDDNCGELLINVTVSRDITKKPQIPFHDKIFIVCMRFLNKIFN